MNEFGKSTIGNYIKILQLKNYADTTISTYSSHLMIFFKFLKKNPNHITLKDYDYFLQNNIFSSEQQNQLISAIKLFYKFILKKKLKINLRPKKEYHIPEIIDRDVLIDKLNNIKNIKHKTILSLTYSTGMRVSEIINLKITDINSKRMLIKINQAKGKKDRFVPLSDYILGLLRTYFKKYKPQIYLFNGQNKLQYSPTSCNKLIKKYINKKYSFHTLRHSCFTHMIENGTDIKIIKELAGHKNIKTTENYLHISKKYISQIKTLL